MEPKPPRVCIKEKRKHFRFRVGALVSFQWIAQDGQPHSSTGRTRDIETTGAYIASRELPPAGARVQLDIHLPGIAGNGPGPELKGEGVVLRVDLDQAESPECPMGGFAVSAQFFLESSVAFGRGPVFCQPPGQKRLLS